MSTVFEAEAIARCGEDNHHGDQEQEQQHEEDEAASAARVVGQVDGTSPIS
jgi:hypothetical protein